MKLLGCLLVFFAAASTGFYGSMELERRRRQLVGLRRALLSMTREIDFQLSPLSEAMIHTAKRAEKPWNIFFMEIGEKLEGRGEKKVMLEQLFLEEVGRIRKEHPWKGDLEELLSLGKELGELDKNMQISRLKMAEEHLILLEKEAEEEQKKKGQLYKSLGVCMGCLGVILLL